jgi:hypothetical protein
MSQPSEAGLQGPEKIVNNITFITGFLPVIIDLIQKTYHYGTAASRFFFNAIT